jgi:hypothetical protein
MARIRYLKPDFFKDEDVAKLPFETRLFFQGLWGLADKAGRLEDRPLRLKAEIFPYDKVDVEKCLQQLNKSKDGSGQPFINRYTTDNQRYIQIVTWEKHQRPHHTEKESTIPPAPLDVEYNFGRDENLFFGNVPGVLPHPHDLIELAGKLQPKEKGTIMEKGMEKGMEKEKENQLEASRELRNGEGTVKQPLKIRYLDFVLLFESEYKKLADDLTEPIVKQLIEELNDGIGSKGYKYKSHYHTIRSWAKRKNLNKQETTEDRIKRLQEKGYLDGNKSS